MDAIERDLLQIRRVRALRADTLQRKQRACDMACQQAYQNIVRAESDITQLERDVITQQRDSLANLLSGNLVGVDNLLNFNRDKLKALKQVIDAKSALNELVHQKQELEQRRMHASALAVVAQKKLIGLDELIDSQPWK